MLLVSIFIIYLYIHTRRYLFPCLEKTKFTTDETETRLENYAQGQGREENTNDVLLASRQTALIS